MKKQTSNAGRRTFLKSAAALAAGASLSPGAAQAAEQKSGTSPLTRTYPVLAETDVLVAGGGPAGIGAALGAALAGAKTLLIENHSFFGGVGAWCLGMPINQMRPKGQHRSKVHELLISKLTALGDQAVRINQHQLLCNVDYLKVAALDALEEAGCLTLIQARAVDALLEGGRVAGVVVATKNGLMAIRARVVVDCTGDGDVATYAGAETMKEPGQLMPMTLCLNLTGVTREQLRKVKMGEVAKKAREKYPLIPQSWGLGQVAQSHNFFINHSGTKQFGNLDATDPWQRTKAEALSRRQAVQMTEAMREFGGPELKEIELIGTGPQLGVRETRRVKGVYVLTEQDAVAGRQFEDTIAWRGGYVDLGFIGPLADMKIHDVPYRAILPEKVDGLLMAGRCISATHVAAAAGKSMGNCMATGHAAGVAAALAAKKNCQPRELKVAEIQEVLRRDGVDLNPADRSQPKNMPA